MEYLGEIRCFAFGFQPRGWSKCDGQLLNISSYTALFSLLGTKFGGDGTTTFGLPDLRGRMMIHQGAGPGLTNRTLGQKIGVESVTLTESQMPSHTHAADIEASRQPPNSTKPVGFLAQTNIYDGTGTTANAPLKTGSVKVKNTGGGKSHDNMQPTLVGNWCICLNGVYPSK